MLEFNIPEESEYTKPTNSYDEDCLDYIRCLIAENPSIQRTLQIGLADGKLADTIVCTTKKLHIVVDPKQEQHKFEGIKWLKSTGNWEFIDFRDDFSYAVLPKLLEGNVLPDLIILDGNLKFDYLLTDFVYSDLIMKKMSYILIRKNELESTKSCHHFIQNNRLEYIIIREFEQYLLYQKIGRDNRDENFFIK